MVSHLMGEDVCIQSEKWRGKRDQVNIPDRHHLSGMQSRQPLAQGHLGSSLHTEHDTIHKGMQYCCSLH